MFIGDLIIAAADESLKGLLEVVVEGDVDEGVDGCVRKGKDVDPELILHQPSW